MDNEFEKDLLDLELSSTIDFDADDMGNIDPDLEFLVHVDDGQYPGTVVGFEKTDVGIYTMTISIELRRLRRRYDTRLEADRELMLQHFTVIGIDPTVMSNPDNWGTIIGKICDVHVIKNEIYTIDSPTIIKEEGDE